VFAVFAGLTLGVAGVSVFTLGMMFNYLVSLFYNRPIRQGLFGKPVFKTPLDKHFWWIGGLLVITGAVLGLVSLAFGLNDGDANRQWFWMLASSMIFIVGVQLLVSWSVMRVLEQLNQRDGKVNMDLAGSAIK
jgi:hypothetical protein